MRPANFLFWPISAAQSYAFVSGANQALLMHRCVAPVIVSLTLAACASETPPLDPEIVPLPRPAPKSLAAPPARPGPKSLAAPLPRPAPKSLSQQPVPWRHLPQPVSDEELKLDQARCSLAAKMALGAGSTEMKFNLVFADCMRSKGYDPI